MAVSKGRRWEGEGKEKRKGKQGERREGRDLSHL